MNEIIELLQQSITDHVLVSGEKKELKQLIKDKNPSPQDFNVLRSEIFKIANRHVNLIPVRNLLDWVETANKLTLNSSKKQDSNTRVYFSPGTQCRDAIIQKINQTKSSLRICVFTISDNEITNAIINASKRGIDIKILSDDDKAYDKGSDVQRMADMGIPTKVDGTRGHMHHKFCIIDEETVINGSYNWTRSAADRNYENILIDTNPQVTKRFLGEFDKLWKKLSSIS
jgi:phosphatidylserine/phosphatidylglycerophosphate/cardiolipin synthase-like enzyme